MKYQLPQFALVTDLFRAIQRNGTYFQDIDVVKEGLDITLGTNGDGEIFGWQTGDNSFTGGAYGYRHWAVVTLFPTSDPAEVAREVFEQWEDLISQEIESDLDGQ